jgi:hypothetical protein
LSPLRGVVFDKGQVLMVSENLDAVMDYAGSQRISVCIVRVGQEVVISNHRLRETSLATPANKLFIKMSEP